MSNLISEQSELQLNQAFLDKFGYYPGKTDELYKANKRSARFINNLQQVEKQYFTNPEFDKELFAEKMQISKSTLQRMMRAITGLTPIQYIRSVQYAMAIELLSNSNQNIRSVARSVGFSDPKYFSRCFRQDFGLTPNEYRSNIRQQKN